MVAWLPLLALAALGACGPSGSGGTGVTPRTVDPEDADAISAVLVIPDTTRVTGSPPPPSSETEAPGISDNQSGAEITVGSTLYLPLRFATQGAGLGYGGIYILVNGASTYFDVPAGQPDGSASWQIVLPIGVPANVKDGEFCLIYCIYDSARRVSNILTTCMTVGPFQRCPLMMSGSEGLTIQAVDLTTSKGEVPPRYDTHTVPDRIDIFQGGTWVARTGQPLEPGQFPRSRGATIPPTATSAPRANSRSTSTRSPARSSPST